MEMGPPWLVVALRAADGGEDVIYRDNFTGAALTRATKVRKDEPGSFAAVMDKYGNFALNPDGRLYDPIEQTKGRNAGRAGLPRVLRGEEVFQ